MSEITYEQIDQARAVLAARWDDEGGCRSCGWHALLGEHDIDDGDIAEALEREDGILRLSCRSKDAEDRFSHRGVKVCIRP